eukprot:TRINITY_DN27419_c0_g1_i1.p1 TRINITY_DN27419_c0_g1~~TRINITY_DN27419_c0_g1_i1.p1  ORF type:complete len:446 (-),score=35.88 TRINITY_DN27419_c0_g1_i1:32-1240(-)
MIQSSQILFQVPIARHLMMRPTVVTLFVVVAVQGAIAWSDEGHMLTAAIARTQLSIDTIESLNRALNGWSEFSNFNDMVSAAVWLDHIRCEQGVSDNRCGGLGTSVALKLFDSAHFEVNAYNPTNMILPDKLEGSDTTHLVTAMQSADESLRVATSPFAINLMLRIGLHIIGDLHQPLHNSQYYSEIFPNGDVGGNRLELVGQEFPNLHKLWDAAGGLFAATFPIPSPDITASAKSIVAEHSADSFVRQGRLHRDWNQESEGFAIPRANSKFFFQSIVTDSRRLIPAIYAEYLAENGSSSTSYSPSVDYVRAVKRNATAQIAIGGYRLAQWLAAVVTSAPPPLARPKGNHMIMNTSRTESPVTKQPLGYHHSPFLLGSSFRRRRRRRVVVGSWSGSRRRRAD